MDIFHQAEGVALDLQKEVLDKLPPRKRNKWIFPPKNHRLTY